jgi:hypothetical protein
MRLKRLVPVATAVGVLVSAPAALPAYADVLVFTNGRTMSVRAHSIDGHTITVTLMSGGEATFGRSAVLRIDPEVIPDDPEPRRRGDTEPLVEVAEQSVTGAEQARFRAEPRLTGAALRPFAALIQEVATRHGMDPELVHAVVEAESNYQPRARSVRGARGLMQVLPSTGAALGARNLYDPPTNLDAGVRYLKALMEEFDLPVALAAYNAGPATVRRFGGVPPFVETQRYVERVLSGFIR